MGTFNLGANLVLAGGKYLAKINFDIKIEISILNVANLNKLWAFLILGTILT